MPYVSVRLFLEAGANLNDVRSTLPKADVALTISRFVAREWPFAESEKAADSF
jgi:hypothetical protein